MTDNTPVNCRKLVDIIVYHMSPSEAYKRVETMLYEEFLEDYNLFRANLLKYQDYFERSENG